MMFNIIQMSGILPFKSLNINIHVYTLCSSIVGVFICLLTNSGKIKDEMHIWEREREREILTRNRALMLTLSIGKPITFSFWIQNKTSTKLWILCLEVWRERRVERSRGEESNGEKSKGKWLLSTWFGYF